MSLRFHIVYVGGTVSRLLPCLDSLLDYTGWEFVLLANGCSASEVQMLHARERRFTERVSVRVVSDTQVRDHGDVLLEVLGDIDDEYFCFLDSDVFASGPTDASVLLPDDGEAAVCSCLPFWHEANDVRMPDGFEIMSGRFIETADGVDIGCTYAAVYRRAELAGVLERWGITLRRYEWRELPEKVQRELAASGFEYRVYDTAKVANLLLRCEGWSVAFREVPSMIHLGGQSGFVGSDSGLKERVRRRVWVSWPTLYGLMWRMRGLGRDECRSLEDLARRRRSVMTLLDQVQDGSVVTDDVPEWIDERAFKAVCALAATGTSYDGSGDGAPADQTFDTR